MILAGMAVLEMIFLKAVYAQETGVTTLDPVVVTGSAHPTQLHQSTQSVTVLTTEQASRVQLNRAATMLQQVPGLHVDEMGGRSGISSLYLRGADPNFTLIMVDGIPMNDSTNQRGGSVDLSTVPLDRVDRIEVVRGPLSAFYGSEAMAGAINFITKSHSNAPTLRLLGEGGRFDSFKGLIQGGGSVGPLSGHISYSHTRIGAQVEKDSFSMDSGGWNFSIQPHPDWDFRLTGQYTDSSVNSFPEGSGGPLLALAREIEHRHTQELLAGFAASSLATSGWRHHLFLSVTRRMQEVSNPGVLSTPTMFQIPPTQFQTLYHRFQARQTETWTLSSRWKLSLGGQLNHERGTREGTQDLSSFGGSSVQPLDFRTRRTAGGLFTEVASIWWKNLTVNTGIRADISQGFQPKISPRIGSAYHFMSSWLIRGGYGKGFKLPSLSSINDPLIGNPALKPETSLGWDVGLEYYTPDKEFTATIEYFHNRFRQLIDLDPDLLRQGIFRLANIEEATTKGWNVLLTLSPISSISFRANLTHLLTRVTETGTPLRNRPKWRGGIAMAFQLTPTVNFTSQVTWVSSRQDFQVPTQITQVGGYTKVDFTLNYHPFPEWYGYIALENVTNASYEEFRGFPSPPLTFRLGLEYRL